MFDRSVAQAVLLFWIKDLGTVGGNGKEGRCNIHMFSSKYHGDTSTTDS